MQVMDAITEILKREGISTMFCFPTTPIIEAAAAGGMRPVICRQERVGVHMADGFARVTNGKPAGVFAMQYGPGAENAFAGIASAYSDSTPVLLLPLGHPRDTAQMFPLFNSTRTYASVTKHRSSRCTMPEQIVPAMRRAFNALKNGRPGPVMVEVPADVHDRRVQRRRDRLPAGAHDALGRRRARHRRRRRSMLIDGRVPMILSPGRACSMPRPAPSCVELAELLETAGHDDDRRQERLPRGPRAGARLRRRRLYRARPAVPARERRDLRDRHSLTRHNISTPIIPRGQEDHPRHQRHARSATRPTTRAIPILGDAKLVLGADCRGGEGPARRQGAPHADAQRRSPAQGTSGSAAGRRSCAPTERPINPYFVMSEFMRVIPSEDAIVTHDSGSPRDQLLPFYVAKQAARLYGLGQVAPARHRAGPRDRRQGRAHPTSSASTSWATRRSA